MNNDMTMFLLDKLDPQTRYSNVKKKQVRLNEKKFGLCLVLRTPAINIMTSTICVNCGGQAMRE